MGTGGTPAPIIARIDKEFAKALDLPEVKDAFAKQGVELFYMNSATLGKIPGFRGRPIWRLAQAFGRAGKIRISGGSQRTIPG